MSNNTYQGLISVIVSTYNWPEALKLVLTALNNQTDSNFEVIIVDDGSTSATKEMIEQFKAVARFPLKHLWQEDKGFRAARARNLGIKNTSGDYIIFLDGDCVPNMHFVENHRKIAETNYFIVGHRIILSESYTQKVLQQQLPLWKKNAFEWIFNALCNNSNKLLPKLYIPFLNRYKKPNKWQGAKTCNLAFWKNDLLAIKGFDESFEGWGFEDSDLVIRILNHGKRRKSGKFATEVFHLWHKEADRSNEIDNMSLLSNLIHSKRITPTKSTFML
ncbi:MULTISPECIES: glycosyltransferase family 2 protein [Cysteiniphilum]|uniref:Glycosyl transferase n=1 Tax=Cysteiniphilum litorale TaxID=2056700 RepID=A0A8J2Z571_9GAMM|nr:MULTISPECIES: glycosyltransferase family 2 protein [Cysteiniphilum]GGG00814.1 glycosyl transferase [Cysteiniphilum litorale]